MIQTKKACNEEILRFLLLLIKSQLLCMYKMFVRPQVCTASQPGLRPLLGLYWRMFAELMVTAVDSTASPRQMRPGHRRPRWSVLSWRLRMWMLRLQRALRLSPPKSATSGLSWQTAGSTSCVCQPSRACQSGAAPGMYLPTIEG